MTVNSDQVIQVFCAALQAHIIAGSEEKVGSAGGVTPKPPIGKAVAEALEITKQAVAALKSAEGLATQTKIV